MRAQNPRLGILIGGSTAWFHRACSVINHFGRTNIETIYVLGAVICGRNVTLSIVMTKEKSKVLGPY